VLDAGALIAVERRSVYMLEAIDGAAQRPRRLIVPAPVLAQVWRDGAGQALLSRFLKLPIVKVELLSEPLWQAVGELCGLKSTTDVVDAAVVICARAKGAQVVITSDPDDLRKLDPILSYWTP
jgi:predicted nucleic acid-binding protein